MSEVPLFFNDRKKKKLESNKTVCGNKDFCYVIMPFEDTKELEFNQNQKFNRTTFIIHTNRECILEKIDGCKHNPENPSTTYSSYF